MTAILRITVGPHACGLVLDDVQEVLRMVAVMPLPAAPSFVEGVINRRGTVTPVIDVRKRVGLSVGPPLTSTRLVITRLHDHDLALVVDDATDVTEVDDEHGIDPSEALGIDLRQYAARAVRVGDDVVVILDPARILTPDEGRLYDAAVERQEFGGDAPAETEA